VAGLRSTLARLAASESFESPRWLSPVCALLYLSIETGVARRLSPGWRSIELLHPPGGPALYSTEACRLDELRVASLALASLRSSLPFDRDWSRSQALAWLALRLASPAGAGLRPTSDFVSQKFRVTSLP